MKKDNCCCFSKIMNSPLEEGVVRLSKARKQIYSSPPGEGVQMGKVRTSPQRSLVFFITETTLSLKALPAASCLLSTIPWPFSHLFKSSLFSNLIDHFLHFVLNFSYLAKGPQIVILVTANNLNSLTFCLLSSRLATSPC